MMKPGLYAYLGAVQHMLQLLQMSACPIYFIAQTLNFLLYLSSFRQTSQNLDQDSSPELLFPLLAPLLTPFVFSHFP